MRDSTQRPAAPGRADRAARAADAPDSPAAVRFPRSSEDEWTLAASSDDALQICRAIMGAAGKTVDRSATSTAVGIIRRLRDRWNCGVVQLMMRARPRENVVLDMLVEHGARIRLEYRQ